MFEKPLYHTPYGLKRLAKSPTPVMFKQRLSLKQNDSNKMSPEAAQVIANALKILIRN
jgi:hypothetical protein